MTVVQVDKNAADLSLVVTSDFRASADEVWRLWADPALFERWWGPPGVSATSQRHEVVSGGRIEFVFNTPEGDKYPQVWEVVEADPPRTLVLRDAEVNDDGTAVDGNGLAQFAIAIAAAGDITRMTLTVRFDSAAGMEHAVASGIEQGMRLTLGKADAALAPIAAG